MNLLGFAAAERGGLEGPFRAESRKSSTDLEQRLSVLYQLCPSFPGRGLLRSNKMRLWEVARSLLQVVTCVHC
jgi:hypothetical protein